MPATVARRRTMFWNRHQPSALWYCGHHASLGVTMRGCPVGIRLDVLDVVALFRFNLWILLWPARWYIFYLA